MYPAIVMPEYAEAKWATKVDRRAWVVGALSLSGTPFMSQKQCHMSRPAPYDTHVSSSHTCSIVSLTCSCSTPLLPGVPA